MAESYCLKPCLECGGCSGCRAGGYGTRCEIARCCKEKGHKSCESCTRQTGCSVRLGRVRMPERLFEEDHRAAENRRIIRNRAEILAKWVGLIFWSVIAMNESDLLGLLAWFVPILGTVFTVVSAGLLLVSAYGYFRLREVDERFGLVALYSVVSLVRVLLFGSLPENNALVLLVNLAFGAFGLFITNRKCMAFRDNLAGISGEQADKWEDQWKYSKYGLCAILIGFLLLPILLWIGTVIIVGALVFLLGLLIRELVCLYRTTEVCNLYRDQAGSDS